MKQPWKSKTSWAAFLLVIVPSLVEFAIQPAVTWRDVVVFVGGIVIIWIRTFLTTEPTTFVTDRALYKAGKPRERRHNGPIV